MTFEVESLKSACREFKKHRWVEEVGSWSGQKLFRCDCGAVHYPSASTSKEDK